MAKKFEDITGNVAIEITDRRYVSAVDNGTFRLGDPRDQGNLTRVIHDSILKDRENNFFSSPELKAQVSFSDHLLSVVCLSVCPSVNFSHFHLLLQNH